MYSDFKHVLREFYTISLSLSLSLSLSIYLSIYLSLMCPIEKQNCKTVRTEHAVLVNNLISGKEETKSEKH